MDIYNVDISNVDISNVDIFTVDISNVDITNVDIPNVDISSVDISNVDISNVDISKARPGPHRAHPGLSRASMAPGRGVIATQVLLSTTPAHKNKPLGILPQIPRIYRKWCQQVWLRPYRPHAPGARMT